MEQGLQGGGAGRGVSDGFASAQSETEGRFMAQRPPPEPEETEPIGNDQVLVLGESDEDIRQHLRAIEQASRAGERSRGFGGDESAFRGKGNRDGVVQRVARRQAKPVLWKVFRSGGRCNLMSEIWIEDKANPDAKKDPCKEYVIVHVHHHSTVRGPQDLQALLKPSQWNNKKNLTVDAVNARHLLGPGAAVSDARQYDNPFYEQRGETYFSSAIEGSCGSTLKLFPPQQSSWACACPDNNFMSRGKCRKQKHYRPCGAWDWDADGTRDQGLASLFRLAHAVADQWLGGGGKNRVRGAEDISDAVGCFRTLADVQNLESQVCVDKTALGLFVGIDEYKNMPRLFHCREDAKAMCSSMERAAGQAALCLELSKGDTPIGIIELGEQLDDFHQRLLQLPPPKLLIFYFAGHGLHMSAEDYVLASDFRPGAKFRIGALGVQELVNSLCPPKLEDTEKYFILDCCRELVSTGESLGCVTPTDFPPTNSVVVFSTKAGFSADDGRPMDDDHGPFCRELLCGASDGIFSSGREFAMALLGACTRYTRNRRKEDKAGADHVGSTECLVRLEDLRAKAEESLRQASSGDLSRGSKYTTRVVMDCQAQIEAVDMGQAFSRPANTAQDPFAVCAEHSSEYEQDVRDFDPEAEPSESGLKKLHSFLSDSELSAASTCSESSFDSFGDDDEDDFLVACSREVGEAKQALCKLESVLAQWIDEMLDDLWVDLEGPLGLQSQEELLGEVEGIVLRVLKESGVTCDSRMSRKMEANVLRELESDEKDKLAEKCLQLCVEKADFLRRVQERARQTFFRVRYFAETGSFCASLSAPVWVAVVFDILLSKHERFRSAVLGLGFHKFQLAGVKIVLRDSAVPDEFGGNQPCVEALRYDAQAQQRIVGLGPPTTSSRVLGDRVAAAFVPESPQDAALSRVVGKVGKAEILPQNEKISGASSLAAPGDAKQDNMPESDEVGSKAGPLNAVQMVESPVRPSAAEAMHVALLPAYAKGPHGAPPPQADSYVSAMTTSPAEGMRTTLGLLQGQALPFALPEAAKGPPEPTAHDSFAQQRAMPSSPAAGSAASGLMVGHVQMVESPVRPSAAEAILVALPPASAKGPHGAPPPPADSYVSAMTTSPAEGMRTTLGLLQGQALPFALPEAAKDPPEPTAHDSFAQQRAVPSSPAAGSAASGLMAGHATEAEQISTADGPSQQAVLDGYILAERLGRGGQGEVWRAADQARGEDVAIKFSRGKLPKSEAAILARISHPNVVRVWRFISEEEAGFSAIVMDFVAGDRLDVFARRWAAGAIPDKVVVKIGRQLLSGLEALHGADPPIIHRDVKPSNIMIDGEDEDIRVVLVDLGVSKELRQAAAARAEEGFQTAVAHPIAGAGVTGAATRHDEGLLVGTLPYWSPEQAMWREDLDTREDLWAVGVVLFELVVGRLPFRGSTKREVLHNVVNQGLLREDVDGLSDEMRSFLQRALNKARLWRFQTCGEMNVGLHALTAEGRLAAFETARSRGLLNDEGSVDVLLLKERDDALWVLAGGFKVGRSALEAASKQGCAQALSGLLAHCDEGTLRKAHMACLLIALEHGHASVCELLLDCLADRGYDVGPLLCRCIVDRETFKIASPARGRIRINWLHAAVIKGFVGVISVMLDRMSEREIKTLAEDGRNALHFGAQSGSSDVVQILLDRMSENEIKTLAEDGRNALHFGVQSGSSDVVQILLDRCCDEKFCLRKSSAFGPPLVTAIQSRDARLCRLLVERTKGSALFYECTGSRPVRREELSTWRLMPVRELFSHNPAFEYVLSVTDHRWHKRDYDECSHDLAGFYVFLVFLVGAGQLPCSLLLPLVVAFGQVSALALLYWALATFLVFLVMLVHLRWRRRKLLPRLAVPFQLEGVWSVFRGQRRDVQIQRIERTLCFAQDHISTVRTVQSCCPGGFKGYYEVEILERVAWARFGFATQGCELLLTTTDQGVGDDECSFGVGDGRVFERKASREVSEGVLARGWQAGDVIGLACDPSAGVWQVSVNGESAPEMEMDADVIFCNNQDRRRSFRCTLGDTIYYLIRMLDAMMDTVIFCIRHPRSSCSQFFNLKRAAPSKILLYAALTCQSGKVRCNLGETPFRHAPPDSEYHPLAGLTAHGLGSPPGGLAIRSRWPESGHSDEASVVLHRGDAGACCVDLERRAVTFEKFSTMLLPVSCPVSCKAYYELTIVRLGSTPRFGFASAGFNAVDGESDEGVGDDAESWGFDGVQRSKWHASESRYSCEWFRGDVIGLACDLVLGKIHVSVNGSFWRPNGALFDLNLEECGSLFPSFSGGDGTEVRHNFGEEPFKHSPPRGGGYKSFTELQADRQHQAPVVGGPREAPFAAHAAEERI